jgi:hypothetical protein
MRAPALEPAPNIARVAAERTFARRVYFMHIHHAPTVRVEEAGWCLGCATPRMVSDRELPRWLYPMKVQQVWPNDCCKETFIDRRSIVYAFRGAQARTRSVDAPYVGEMSFSDDAIYLRDPWGVYRKTSFRGAVSKLAQRLPPSMVEVVHGSILINLAMVPKEWDGTCDSNLRRVGYRFRSAHDTRRSHIEWLRVSRRCTPRLLELTA